MNTLDYLILFTVLASCVFSWLDNRQTKKREIDLINKWAEAEKETNYWIESYGDLQKNFNELNKLYQATKAELEFTNKVYIETQKKLHKSNYTIDSLHKENDKLQAELELYKSHESET